MENISNIYSTSDFVDYISKQYNYDNKLSEILVVIINGMLDYYGEERKKEIYEAFSDNYIHIQEENENPTQYLTEYFGDLFEFNTNPSIITCGELSRSTMKNRKIKTKKIVYITEHFKDVDLKKTDVFSDVSLQVLIHELNHCIKGNWEGRVLNDNEFEIANGLNHTVFSTLHDPYDIVSDTYENIEEAINTVQEYDIFKIITGRNPVPYGSYKNIQKVMRKMLSNYPKLYSVIIDSEFNHDNNWLNYIGEENALALDNTFKKDVLSQQKLIQYDSIFDDSKEIVDNIGSVISSK